MEEETALPVNEARKLRKKLRQIDNLERQRATRELTDSEIVKVEKKYEIREALKALVKKEEPLSPASVEGDEDSDCELLKDIEINNSEDAEENKLTEEPCEEVEDTSALNTENEVDKEKTTEKVEQSVETSEKSVKKVEKSWKKRQFSLQVLEGHHHPVCSVDTYEDTVVSGGYDSTVRVWNANTGVEKFSLGGHVGGVTAVLILPWGQDSDNQFVSSGSLDCSVKVWNIIQGTMVKSLYVFSPVKCLAYGCNLLAVGNEGGKVQLLNLDTNCTVFSVNCHDEAVTCIKFLPDNHVATGSDDGEVKVFHFENDALEQVFSTEDGIRSIDPSNPDVSLESTESESQGLRLRKINCLEVFQDNLIWGDDGYNLKVLDWKNGSVTKVRNNLQEYCPTEALAVLTNQEMSFLFSSGFDLDVGNSYINVRTLPSLDYAGTVSTTTLGHVSSISASAVDGKIRLVTGGSELKVWNEVNRSMKRRADAMDDIIPCKYNCSYNTPRESEEEDYEDHSEENEEDENEVEETEEEATETGGRWCVIS